MPPSPNTAVRLQRVAVIGAGTMGTGIAHAFATTGSQVLLVDPDPTQREAAVHRITALLESRVEKGKLSADDAAKALSALTTTESIDTLPTGLDLAVESVPERIDLKRQVLRVLEDTEPVVLASNTSSISIDSLAEGLTRPERLIGMHFFNPVWSMRLVEIVVGSATASDVTDAVRSVVSAIGKEFIVVRDSPGFATSRLGVALGLEATRMLESGIASVEDIDKAMVLGYGHPMGPLRLGDLVGLDIRLDVARYLTSTLGERFAPPALLETMVAEGHLGQKSGQGFYTWSNEGP